MQSSRQLEPPSCGKSRPGARRLLQRHAQPHLHQGGLAPHRPPGAGGEVRVQPHRPARRRLQHPPVRAPLPLLLLPGHVRARLPAVEQRPRAGGGELPVQLPLPARQRSVRGVQPGLGYRRRAAAGKPLAAAEGVLFLEEVRCSVAPGLRRGRGVRGFMRRKRRLEGERSPGLLDR